MRIEEAIISSNERIGGGIWRMKMETPTVAQATLGPGQFVNILVSDSWEMPIRRPMSIAGVRGSSLEIIYKVFGLGTIQLSQKTAGESIDILGPLGNTFNLDNTDLYPILVGGGVGIAPILWLHHILHSRSRQHDLIIGAVTKEEHFMEHQPQLRVFLTTDDGSKGEKGTVMPTLTNLSSHYEKKIIYACGPEPMLKAIHDFVAAHDILCQMALESYMGCGTGVCQGCAIHMKNSSPKRHSYHERYSLVCIDGPVYQAQEVDL